MEYQKIINLLDNTSNQSCKFKTKNWLEINDESRETYSINSQIKFKTTMLIIVMCIYLLTVPNTAAADADANNANKKVIFKNYA